MGGSMSHFKKLITVLVLGAILSISGCAQGGQRGEGCGGEADNPHVSSGQLKKLGVKQIVGKTRFGCEGVARLELTVYVERLVSGVWRAQASNPETYYNPVSGKEYVLQASTSGCVSGTYRTSVKLNKIVLASGKVASIQKPYDYSQTVSLKC